MSYKQFQLPLTSSLSPVLPWDGVKGSFAAVGVLLVPSQQGARVVLTKRSETVGTHKGQISCPGGFKEVGDVSPADTAKREIEEELGVDADLIQVHGCLAPLISRHGAHVIAVLMSAPYRRNDFLLEKNEVAELLLPLWSELRIGKLRGLWLPRWCPARGYRLASGRWVWGLTAEIFKKLDFHF